MLPTALPLGISFYTFQQIAYLVDLSKGACERAPFPRHQLLVSFFPHHIAGPITHPRSFLPQLRDVRFDWSMIALGLFILGLGLAKKVALADPLGRFVDPAFANPAALSGANAWAAVVAYTLQLYLDFSGYSDMAVGLGLMFGMRLPWNFDSPYKAASIAAFWRRWHITLSDFLRQYVYVPLGGSRSGKSRTLVNLLLTMLIGGIWHGAGWTFVLWGALHGAALAINHAWRWREAPLFGPGPRRALGWALTMLVVMFGWVLFRSNTLQDAWTITKRMAGVGGPHTYWPHPALASVVPMMVVSLGVVWLTPNVREWSERFRSTWPWLLFGAMAWAVAMVRILSNMKPPEFLYFDF